MQQGAKGRRMPAWIGAAAAVAGLAALPGGHARAQDCPGADAPAGTSAAQLELAVLCLVDAARDRAGVPRLQGEPRLAAAARAHARDMVARHYFGRTSPEGADDRARATAAGYPGGRRVSGAIAFGVGERATPRRIVTDLLAGPDARQTLLSTAFREIGAGAAEGAPDGGSGATTYAIVLAEGAPAGPPSPAVPAVAPGKVEAKVLRGTVTAQAPAGAARAGGPAARASGAVRLTGTRVFPIGTRFDTVRGTVQLRFARDLAGGVQTAVLRDGRFRTAQQRSGGVLTTEARLVGAGLEGCRAGAARAARRPAGKRRKGRRLWTRTNGRFRTRGRRAATTVRGTEYLTEDTCAGTRVVVRSGAVDVRDLHRRVTRRLKAGQSWLVRAP